jgi:hypothetical protein
MNMEQIMLIEKEEQTLLSRIIRKYSGKRKDGQLESTLLEIFSNMAWNG